MILNRFQMEEGLVRLIAPANPHLFRNWLESLPLDTLRLEYRRASEPLPGSPLPRAGVDTGGLTRWSSHYTRARFSL
jgi:hypothetical protein